MSTEGEQLRYSDSELAEFKIILEDKLAKSKVELKYYQDQLNKGTSNGTDDTLSRFSIEDGQGNAEREYFAQMISRQTQFITHLSKALQRVENKTYGICRDTGKLISKERLRAVPHATLSIDAKKAQER